MNDRVVGGCFRLYDKVSNSWFKYSWDVGDEWSESDGTMGEYEHSGNLRVNLPVNLAGRQPYVHLTGIAIMLLKRADDIISVRIFRIEMVRMHMAKRYWILLISLLGVVIFSGCGGAGDPAANVVQKYLQAMVAGDASQTTKLACKDFEDQASKDADSFAGVKASLDSAVCQKTGSDSSGELVSCSGKINATYGNEQQAFDLAGPTYKVIQQNGDWLVCGRQ
jgi:hypothetical protein